jgi:hypothetical protein
MFNEMHGQLLAEGLQQQQNFGEVEEYLQQPGQGCTMFLLLKDPRWRDGQGNKPLGILRARINAGEWSFDGYKAQDNSAFLRRAPVLTLLAAHNWATTRDADAPLVAHADEHGRHCRAAINAYHLLVTGDTRLFGQTQANCIFVLDDGRLLCSEREGEARIVGGWRKYAYDLGYESDDAGVRIRVGIIKRPPRHRRDVIIFTQSFVQVLSMLANPRNSRDALRMRCIADATPVDEETGRAHGFLAGLDYFTRRHVLWRDQVKVDADSHRALLRTLTDRSFENGTALAACIDLAVILEGERRDVDRCTFSGGAAWGAAATFGRDPALWTSTASAGKYFAERGVDVYDATISGGRRSVEDFLGRSKHRDRIPPGIIMVASNGYAPPLNQPHERINQFRAAADRGRAKPKIFRESLLVAAFRDHGGDVFFPGYEAHSMYEWGTIVTGTENLGCTKRVQGWVLRERGPGGVRYGVPPAPGQSSSSSRRRRRRGK